MKLLFVIDRLGGAVGGAERVLCEVASALAERGHDVAIASFDADGVDDSFSVHEAIRRLRLDPVSRGSALSSLLARPGALRRLLKQAAPDVAIGFMASAYVPLGLAAIGTGVPIVASEHTAWDHYRRHPAQALALRLAASMFAASTIPSGRIGGGFPSNISRRMVAIPNPVTLEPRKAKQLPDRRCRLLSVGNLRREKGHRILVSAFARLAPRFPDWDLRIVGDGPERVGLEAQVRALELERRVAFGGTVIDVAGEYAAADLFAIPSSYESFGIAAAEALAAGLPVIGFADCPGTNELVQHGANGLLVAGPDRVAALANGLSELMRSPGQRSALGAAGPASVERFSLSAITDQWERLLRKVAAQ